jgi:hypothetical protein
MSNNLVPVSKKMNLKHSDLKKVIVAFSNWHSKKERVNDCIPTELCEMVMALSCYYSVEELASSLSISYGSIRDIILQETNSLKKNPKSSTKKKFNDLKLIEVTPHLQNLTRSSAIEFCRPDGFKMTISDHQLAKDVVGLFFHGGLI